MQYQLKETTECHPKTRQIDKNSTTTTFKTNNDKQIAVQCFRFALFCSRRLRFIPFIVFPVFILAMLNNANLFCFSRENRPHPFFEDSLAISLPALAHLAR